jgi:hypothetical protein
VSFQITILKVLAGHPDGRASLVDLKRYVAVLTTSGADWSRRIKQLAQRAPVLDIFSSSYVLRHPDGWQITDAGLTFLKLIEAPTAPAREPTADTLPVVSVPPALPSNVVRLAGHKARRRGRRAA